MASQLRTKVSLFGLKKILLIGRFDTPTHHIVSFLIAQCRDVVVIKTSMQIHKTLPLIEITHYDVHRPDRPVVMRDPFTRYAANAFLRPVQYMVNYLYISGFILWYGLRHHRYDVVIGIGPLNGALAALYGFMYRVKKTVYYAEDKIADDGNDIFSKLTYASDYLARSLCNAVWVMSEAYIRTVPKHIIDKYSFVPIPIMPYGNDKKKLISGKRIVFLGSIALEHGYDMLYAVFKRLLKIIPSLHLVIIGSGSHVDAFVRQYTNDGLAPYIEYKGFITDHAQILRIISQSHVGVCLYNPYIYKNLAFGQSSKISNYISCGLPVVVTGSKRNMPSLAFYVKKYQAGFVVAYNQDDIYYSLKRLLINGNIYSTMKKNTTLIQRNFDNHTHYIRAFEKLFINMI